MSADNGHIVMVKQTDDGYDYRVAYYNASLLSESGTEYDPDNNYRKRLWEGGKPFKLRGEALEYAHDLENKDWTEYGVHEENFFLGRVR